MPEQVELFRVQAVRYSGPSATKGGYSDKVWAGVILKRVPSVTAKAAWRFVAVWGPTGGTLQSKAQPWTDYAEVGRRYDDEMRKKVLEGYQSMGWQNIVGMERYINALPARHADPVTSGDTARKAWQTRKASEPLRTAEGERAAGVLGDGPLARQIDADAQRDAQRKKTQPPTPPTPEPETRPSRAMRSLRRDMKLD
jgi:hypothetical protein